MTKQINSQNKVQQRILQWPFERRLKFFSFILSQTKDFKSPLKRYSLLTPYFQTTSLERKKNAEILTPDWVANEMIDKLVAIYGIEQLSQWKIIEPCCGKGVFLINLYKRLQEYHLNKGLNQEEAHSASIEHLYWNDLNRANVEFCNIMMGSNKGTSKDGLQVNYQEFDLVITNPPYNSLFNKSLYKDFIIKFSNNKNCLLIPIQNQVFTKADFRKVYSENEFQNVQVTVEFVINCQYQKELDKKETKYLIQANFVKNENLEKEYKEDYIKCVCTQNQSKNLFMYCQKYYILTDYSFYKICIIKSRSKRVYLLGPNEICNNSFYYIKCNNKEQAEKLYQQVLQFFQQDEVFKNASGKIIMNKKLLELRLYKFIQ